MQTRPRLSYNFTLDNIYSFIEKASPQVLNTTVDLAGHTALTFAASQGHELLSAEIKGKGANPIYPAEIQDEAGQPCTPLGLAKGYGFYRTQLALEPNQTLRDQQIAQKIRMQPPVVSSISVLATGVAPVANRPTTPPIDNSKLEEDQKSKFRKQ